MPAVTIDTDAKILSEDVLGFGQQHIIELSNGNMYAAQINDSGEVEVHESTDGGSTWALDTSFTGLTGVDHLSLCKSEQDDVFVCYNETTPQIIVKRKHYSTGVWSTVQTETAGVATWSQGLITYNRSINRLHLVWLTSNGWVISTRYSDDYGATWSSVSGWSWGSGPVGTGNWALDSSPTTGSLYLFAHPAFFTPQTIIFNSAGARTGSENDLGGTVTFMGGAIAVSNGGDRWRLEYYLDSGTYHLRVLKNTSTSLDVSSGTEDYKSGMFAVGIDNLDNVYIFYVKESDGHIYYRAYTAATDTWGSETEYTTKLAVVPTCVQAVRPGGSKLRVTYFSSPVS